MALLEELVQEVLLRFPPADPASLVRAALVCKPWCRLVSGRRFRRRFRDLHGSPPMLGFICNLIEDAGGSNLYGIARFVPTCSSTSSFRPRRADHRDWHAREARHSLVLLGSGSAPVSSDLFVWDPITDEWRELPPVPDIQDQFGWNATVLSADDQHLDDCHGRPFLVVSLYCSLARHISLCIYSSEPGSWSEPVNVTDVPSEHSVHHRDSTALVGDALYFDMGGSMLMYDVATRETCMIPLPPFDESEYEGYLDMLMAMEDGGMGVARAEGTTLTLWSMETSPNNRDIRWARIRVIELDKLLRVSAASIVSNWVGFAAGTSDFFVNADEEGLFTLDIKSDQVKMVLKGKCVVSVVSYMTFCTPAPGSVIIDEAPELDASIAHVMKTDAGAGHSNP